MNNFRKKLQSYISSENLPEEHEAIEFIDSAISDLENEICSYRPKSMSGKSGGLLDFHADFNLSKLPVIVVPDLHGRADFLLKLLDSNAVFGETDCETVLKALSEEKVMIVCVGDGVHGEVRVRDRWLNAYDDFLNGNYTGTFMTEEMHENISTIQCVMSLKNKFPFHFHFLKGNHENILNQDGNGNYSFRKFAQEGIMVRKFIESYYGDAVLHLIDVWEKSLPICALFSDFAVTHAEPAYAFSREEVINYDLNTSVISALTWTANDCAETNSCLDSYLNLTGQNPSYPVFWVGGHRPVEENYALRQNSAYIQIHNPLKMNVAVFVPGKEFVPEKDIRSVEG